MDGNPNKNSRPSQILSPLLPGISQGRNRPRGIACHRERGTYKERIGMETKESPICEHHPGRPNLIDKNGRSMGRCLECLREQSRTRKARKDRVPVKIQKKGSTRHSGKDFVVSLDFSRIPDVMEKIKANAEKNFRTVECEILFYLSTV